MPTIHTCILYVWHVCLWHTCVYFVCVVCMPRTHVCLFYMCVVCMPMTHTCLFCMCVVCMCRIHIDACLSMHTHAYMCRAEGHLVPPSTSLHFIVCNRPPNCPGSSLIPLGWLHSELQGVTWPCPSCWGHRCGQPGLPPYVGAEASNLSLVTITQ